VSRRGRAVEEVVNSREAPGATGRGRIRDERVKSGGSTGRKGAEPRLSREARTMNAQRTRRRETHHHNDERSSGVFELPAAARVARRGSTRVEPSSAVDAPSSGRGRALRGGS
jgi:hypothetical protein